MAAPLPVFRVLLASVLVFLFGTAIGLSAQNCVILTLFAAIPNAAIFPIFGQQVDMEEDVAGTISLLSYALAFATLSGWYGLLTG